jgi:release factor glutamine methyltransferase
VTTISQALTQARHQLQTSSPSPASDASILLCHVLDCSSSHLIAWPDKQLSDDQSQRYNALIEERRKGKPVAYITGEKEFWSLLLKVTPAVLIPRPETEILVEFALEALKDNPKAEIADLGTGSGAIACALASEQPGWHITATDTSAEALAIARQNAETHQLHNIDFVQGHWFEALQREDYDMVISNPPYVAAEDPHLGQGDVRFEPDDALSAGIQGMDDIEVIAREAADHLVAGGWLAVEHGYDQQQLVHDCFARNGFVDITQQADLSGTPRITAARKR